jgi:competence protein ComEC
VLALPLLAPIILASVAATVFAPLWSLPATICLDLGGFLILVLRWVSAPARGLELVTPPMPIVVAALLVVAGWVALQPQRWARLGVMVWAGTLVVLGFSWALAGPTAPPTVELLPVNDGAAVLVADGSDALLSDAGRFRREAAQLLAESRHWTLRALIVSHTDEDHVGGATRVLGSFRVEQLIVPVWMLRDPQVVPLLRAARRRATRIHPMAAGEAAVLGSVRIEVVWPPLRDPPQAENERSLVLRAISDCGTVLITGDIGRRTETALARTGCLRSTVLVVPHHGARGSTSRALLEASSPQVALIPAGPGNTHGHPSLEARQRLSERHIPYRYPARDGRCGARWTGQEWVPYP